MRERVSDLECSARKADRPSPVSRSAVDHASRCSTSVLGGLPPRSPDASSGTLCSERYRTARSTILFQAIQDVGETLGQFLIPSGLQPASGVDCSELGLGASKGGDEGGEPVWVLVGKVFAVFLVQVGGGEVEGVGFSSSADGYVGPFPTDVAVGDGVGALGGGALGFVAGEGVAPVEVSFVEIPVGDGDGPVCAVEADAACSLFRVDCGDGGEVAVEDSQPGPVLEADNPVTGLELPVSDSFDVSVPGRDGLVDAVGDGGGGGDPVTSVVHGDGPVNRAVAELGESCAFLQVMLADVFGEFNGGEADGEGSEETAGVDLGELVGVADKDELPRGGVDQVADLNKSASADHARLIDHYHGALGKTTGGRKEGTTTDSGLGPTRAREAAPLGRTNGIVAAPFDFSVKSRYPHDRLASVPPRHSLRGFIWRR